LEQLKRNSVREQVEGGEMTRKELREAEEFASQIAREAGEITLRYFKKGVAVSRKRDGSFVTTADHEAEAFLRAELARRYPADGILGEEEGESPGTSGRRWVIDPIDGTFSFVHEVPFFGVMIALEVSSEPVVGIVNIPALGELVSASSGNGCRLNGERARVSDVSTLDSALLLSTDFGACSRYGFGLATQRLEAAVQNRRTWGDCYGYVLVATGRAEIMLDPVMNVWDCAPLLPIMEEAGGTFTDWWGARTILGGNAIATNGRLFDPVMSIVQSSQNE
jgi:histidinol phosphatase-like enzyme (inositol monophosphatase family)